MSLDPAALPLGVGPPAILVLLGVAFVAGLARGFSGFGAALIFIPLAGAAVGPRVAAPLLLIVDGLSTLTLVPGAWRQAERSDVGAMALGALAGVPLGVWALAAADPLVVRWTVTLLVLGLLVVLMTGLRYRGPASTPLSVGIGGVAGFFSGLAQVGGPPVVAYWLGRALPAGTVRANIILYFALSSVIAGASYLSGGLVTAQVLALTLLTIPPYALGLLAGSRLFGRASETTFRRLCYGLIAAAAILSMPLLDGVIR